MPHLSIQVSPTLDVRSQVQSLAAYLATRWEGLPDGEALLGLVKEIAGEAFSKEQFVLLSGSGSGGLAALLHEPTETRRNTLARHPLCQKDPLAETLLSVHDAVCQGLLHMRCEVSRLQSAASSAWDFTREANTLANKLFARFPSLSSARPLGWADFVKDYWDYKGQDTFNSTPELQALGDVGCSQLAADFVHNVGLPYVAYDDICQGRKPARVLVASLFGFFLTFKARSEEHAMSQELAALPHLAAPDVLFAFKPDFRHPLLQELAADIPEPVTAEALEAALASRAAFLALPLEEQNRIQTEFRLKIAERLARRLSKDGTEAT